MKIVGYNNLIKQLRALGKEGQKAVARASETVASEIELDAKLLAPVDTGKLRQSIKKTEITPLRWSIAANATGIAPYAPYIEFGTGGLVDVPPELAEIAIQFKGKGIRKINLPPRPYMYPAFVKGRYSYIAELSKELEALVK